MTTSIPRVLVSRDGSVRMYVGHSNQSGTLYGRAERHGPSWIAICAGCRYAFGGQTQRDVAYSLRDHWEGADASMSANHQH